MDVSPIFQTLIETLIQLLVPVICGYIIYLGNKLGQHITLRMSKEKQEIAAFWAKQIVLAAEQTGVVGELIKTGNAKKEWALVRLESILRQKGIRVDVPMLSDLIEAAVHEAFNLPKTTANESPSPQSVILYKPTIADQPPQAG